MNRTTDDRLLHRRLAEAVHIIEVMDGRRIAYGDDSLGSNIERMILDRELSELEHDICLDPGALAPLLVRVTGPNSGSAETL